MGNWIRTEDIKGLKLWANHFSAFTPLLVYPYQITDNKYLDKLKGKADIIEFDKRNYGIVAIELSTYYTNAKSRSTSWDAINVSRDVFQTIVKPVSFFIPELKKNW